MNPSLLGYPRQLAQDLRAWLMPIGAGIEWWADEADIPGPKVGKRWFIVPAGQDILASEYPRLYAMWFKNGVHKFGAGSVSNSTKAPDMRGRMALTKDDIGGTAASRVTSGGSGIAANVLGNAGGHELLSAHNHGISDSGHFHNITDPAHAHTEIAATNDGYPPYTGPQQNNSGVTITLANFNTSTSGTGISIQTAATGIGISTTGTGTAQNMPPFLVCNYIIRAG